MGHYTGRWRLCFLHEARQFGESDSCRLLCHCNSRAILPHHAHARTAARERRLRRCGAIAHPRREEGRRSQHELGKQQYLQEQAQERKGTKAMTIEVIIVDEEQEQEQEQERGLIVLPSAAELEQLFESSTAIFSGQFDPYEQITRITKRVHEIPTCLRVNMLELGLLLERAKDVTFLDEHDGCVKHLYDGAGYPDLNSWCTAMGIPAEFRRTAIALYKATPYMLNLGYSVAEIVGSLDDEAPEEARLKLTTVKARRLVHEERDHNRQLTEAEQARAAIESELVALDQKANLPPSQREILRAQIQQRLAGALQQKEEKLRAMRERADLFLRHLNDQDI